MEPKRNMNREVIAAATTLLQPYFPEISPVALVEALRAYKPSACRPRQQRPYTRQEVAELLGVSMQSINRYLNSGLLRRIKIGLRAVRIDPASVSALLNETDIVED